MLILLSDKYVLVSIIKTKSSQYGTCSRFDGSKMEHVPYSVESVPYSTKSTTHVTYSVSDIYIRSDKA